MSSNSGGHPGPGYIGNPARLQAVHRHMCTHTLFYTNLHSHTCSLTPSGSEARRPACSSLLPTSWRGLICSGGTLAGPQGNRSRTRAKRPESCRHSTVWEKGIQEDGRDCQGPSKGRPAGPVEKMLKRGLGGTRWKKRLSPPLPHPNRASGARALGIGGLGNIRGSPVSYEGTEMGSRSWRTWTLPQVPQGGRKKVKKQEGSYMLVMGATRLGKLKSCFSPQPWGG